MGDKIDGLHNHSWRTKTALQSVVFTKGGLHWVKIVHLANTFDGNHFSVSNLNSKHCTRLNCTTIQMHCAGPTLGGIAAYMGTC